MQRAWTVPSAILSYVARASKSEVNTNIRIEYVLGLCSRRYSTIQQQLENTWRVMGLPQEQFQAHPTHHLQQPESPNPRLQRS